MLLYGKSMHSLTTIASINEGFDVAAAQQDEVLLIVHYYFYL